MTPDGARAEALRVLKLYMIQFDGEQSYVEAPSFAAAIAKWHAFLRLEVPGWSDTEEPESVTLIHDQPVIR